MNVDYSPRPEELIGEMERESIDWATSLSELIDNSFDANANRVVIEAGKGVVSVTDDGDGCPTPELMLRRGHSTKRNAKSTLGRYGIGLKHASYFICQLQGDTRIASVHGGRIAEVQVNWGKMVASGSWMGDAPRFFEATADNCQLSRMADCRGTVICFQNVARNLPGGKTLEQITDTLSCRFSPALHEGKQIVVVNKGTRISLKPPKPPEFVEFVDRTISVNGKGARIRVGMVDPATVLRRPGINYTFGHRVIVENTAHGCGPYPRAHVTGVVELDGAWKLGQNKCSVSDQDWELLGDEVLRHLTSLLEKAAAQTQSIVSDQLKGSIEELVNEGIGKAKRPNRGKSTGTREAKGTGRTVRRATVVAGIGSVHSIARGSTGRVTVEFIANDSDPICTVDLPSNRVTINTGHEFAARIQRDGNQDAIVALVVQSFLAANLAAGELAKTIKGLPNARADRQFAEGLTQVLGNVSLNRDKDIRTASA